MSCRTGLRSLPFDRRRIEAGERVRRRQDEQQEGSADPALHGQHVGAQRCRQVAPEHRDQRAEEGEDQHPQQHRAFVVAPGAGDLEQHRLQRVGVLPDIGDREIRLDIGHGQRREGDRGQREAGDGDGSADRHHALVAAPRADQRHRRLDQRQREGQHEREMPGLNHGRVSLQRIGRSICQLQFGCHTPFSFRLSATSLGM